MEGRKNPVKDKIYADHATKTPIFQSVKAAMVEKLDQVALPFLLPYESNKKEEQEFDLGIKTIRELLLIGNSAGLFFTHDHQESFFEVYRHHLETKVKKTGKNHILYLDCQEPAQEKGIQFLKQSGCLVEKIPLDQQGQIDYERLKALISPKTGLISITWVHPLLGIIQPLEEIYTLVEEKKIDLHLDVTFGLGKIFFRAQDLPIEYLTFDPKRIGGPPGIGVYAVKTVVQPQERFFLAEPDWSRFFGFVSFSYEMLQMTDEFFFEIPLIKEKFEKTLKNTLEEVEILWAQVERIQTHSVVYFPGVHQEMMLFYLNQYGAVASIGYPGKYSLESALLEAQIVPEKARSALVFSFSFQIDEAAIVELVERIAQAYWQALRISQGVQDA